MPESFIYTMTFGDESKEKSSVTFHPPNINAANYETYFGDTGLGFEQALKDAVQAFSLGSLMSTTGASKQDLTGTYPVDPNAQRERKLLVSYVDSGWGRRHSFEIPVYNLVGKLPGSDEIDITAPEWVALQAALDEYVGPDGGSITLVEGRLVGRNI